MEADKSPNEAFELLRLPSPLIDQIINVCSGYSRRHLRIACKHLRRVAAPTRIRINADWVETQKQDLALSSQLAARWTNARHADVTLDVVPDDDIIDSAQMCDASIESRINCALQCWNQFRGIDLEYWTTSMGCPMVTPILTHHASLQRFSLHVPFPIRMYGEPASLPCGTLGLLEHLCSLQELSLCSVPFDDVGDAFMVIGHLTQLQALVFKPECACDINVGHVFAAIARLARLTRLDVQLELKMSSAEVFRNHHTHFSLPCLKKLKFFVTLYRISNDTLEYDRVDIYGMFTSCTALTRLECDADDFNAANLQFWPQLAQLQCQNCIDLEDPYSLAGILSECTCLTSLQMYELGPGMPLGQHDDVVEQRVPPALQQLKVARWDMSRCPLMSVFAPALSQLIIEQATDDTASAKADFSCLLDHPSLSSIHLHNNFRDIIGLEALDTLTALTSMRIQGCSSIAHNTSWRFPNGLQLRRVRELVIEGQTDKQGNVFSSLPGNLSVALPALTTIQLPCSLQVAGVGRGGHMPGASMLGRGEDILAVGIGGAQELAALVHSFGQLQTLRLRLSVHQWEAGGQNLHKHLPLCHTHTTFSPAAPSSANTNRLGNNATMTQFLLCLSASHPSLAKVQLLDDWWCREEGMAEFGGDVARVQESVLRSLQLQIQAAQDQQELQFRVSWS